MAITRSAFTFSLLITTAICLMAIKAEEQPTAEKIDDIQIKQMHLMPQYYPANTQFYYPDRRYGNFYPSPYAMPSEEPFVDGSPDVGFAYGYQIFASGDDGTSDGKRVKTGDRSDPKGMLLRSGPVRQATINIFPVATECLNTPVGFDDEGLGPCKAASQAERGTINIRFSAADQSAIIAITADSQRHTRVTLTCTNIGAATVFTQSGQINAVADTPRTEIGYIQLVATSTAPNGVVNCNWISHHHNVAMFP